MFYIDTSVLAAYYCPEPSSDQAETFLSGIDLLTISRLAEVELFSALSRKVRTAELSQEDAKKIAAKFYAHMEGKYFHLLPVTAHHYALAREWLGQFVLPLKTLDALHLAIASCEDLTIVTFDRQLAQNATELDIRVLIPE